MLSNCGAEKTLVSLLDSKETKPANPKGNQSWIFIGRIDVEAPILWPPNAKSQLIGKFPDARKDWRREEKGTTEDEMVGWHHQLDGHELEQTLEDGEGQRSLRFLGSQSQTWLNWTTATRFSKKYFKIIASLFCFAPTFLAFFQLLVVTVLSLAKWFLWLATFSFRFC